MRKPPKRVDYLLRYTRDFPLAVIEAKAAYKSAGDGLQQAKDYAAMLGLKFAYATNGREIIEFDYLTGRESVVTDYSSPAKLWSRYRVKPVHSLEFWGNWRLPHPARISAIQVRWPRFNYLSKRIIESDNQLALRLAI